jgi:protein-S-isoprenylcysteine O-methyltransferase Ste14
MSIDDLLIRRALVSGTAAVYWAGVLVWARAVRWRIGRTPNLRPRGARERWLWLGWTFVVGGWLVLPWFIVPHAVVERGAPWLFSTSGLAVSCAILALSYLGTLWCYAAMGTAWRIGIDRREKTRLVKTGPYRWIRHPIYCFQTTMLVGAAMLLPHSAFVLLILVHLACVQMKARDEERYLLALHGTEYREYLNHTGRLVPRFR